MKKKHNLKCFVDRYKYIASGECTADVRPDDRQFSVGDLIIYHEGYPDKGLFHYTGNTITAKITYIDVWGLPRNYVNLSIKKLEN